jgi:TRAP-type C4-dicarboxylate transport system substrate-binding protein
VNPKGFWVTANEITFAENLAKTTGGKFKINVFPGGSAGFQGVEVLDAVSENLLQMAEVWGGHVAGQEKVMELLDLPQFVPGDFEFRKKLWAALHQPFADYLGKRYNVVVLDYMQIQPRRLYTKTPVKTLADMKGLKIRAIGPADATFTQALGAEATTTNWGELYVALQQGLVDGHWAADGATAAMKFYEVTKYIYDTQNAGPSFFIMANRQAFEALPPDLKKAFLEGVEDLKRTNRESYPTTEGKARQALIANGMQANAVADADQAHLGAVSGPIVEKWARELDPDARRIFDIAKGMIDAHHAGR